MSLTSEALSPPHSVHKTTRVQKVSTNLEKRTVKGELTKTTTGNKLVTNSSCEIYIDTDAQSNVSLEEFFD